MPMDAYSPAYSQPSVDGEHGAAAPRSTRPDGHDLDAVQRRLIGRLCIAARGLDPRLDEHLTAITAAVRQSCTVGQLEQLVERLSTTVAALPDRHAAKQLSGSSVALLLGRLEFVPGLQPRVDDVRRRLQDGGASEAQLAEELAVLLAEQHSILSREKTDAEKVLQQVTNRLDEMAGYLQSESRDRRDAQDNSQDLNIRLLSEMQVLDQNVRSASELATLQRQVRERLEQIGGHLHRHREREDARWREYQARADQMRQRIDELENATRSLRESAERGQQLAMTDALTGIPNRLAYQTHICGCFDRLRSGGPPPVIAVCDIDHFKRINDRWGHPAGDRVLRVVALVLTRNVREGDFVARYGGEEFVVVFEGLPAAAAQRRADVLRRLIEQIDFHVGEESVPVTMSCGLTVATGTDTVETAFERADQALYRAKRAGRNRCICL